MCCNNFHNWLVSKLELPDDDEVMAKRKQVVVYFFGASFTMGILAIPTVGFTVAYIAAFLAVLSSGAGLVILFVTKNPSDLLIESVGYCDLIAIILVDINSMGAMLPRVWALTVVVIDIFLVCRVRAHATKVVVSCLCLWFLFTSIEESFRFGLLDIEVGNSGSFLGNHPYRFERVCSCAKLPCKIGIDEAALVLFLMLSIFLLDFHFTRGFAQEVLAEKHKLELGILTAHGVATFLAEFQLDEASDRLLSSEDEVPKGLHEVLQNILTNLRSYRPYLPQSCFVRTGDEESTASDVAPDNDISTARSSSISTREKSLEFTRATMLVMNMRNSITAAEFDPTDFISQHSRLVGFALRVIRSQKGMLDLFVGDHVHASFNASKRCAQHAVAAVKAGVMLRRSKLELGMEVNVAVCSGRVQVGDLGNDEVRRFSIHGHAAVLSSVYERLGAEWGIGVVCNSLTYSDASVTQEIRIVLKAVTFVKGRTSKVQALWEIIIEGESLGLSFDPGRNALRKVQSIIKQEENGNEWMYELQNSKAGKWADYNEAAKMYLQEQCLKDKKMEQTALGLLQSYKDEPHAEMMSHLITRAVPVETRSVTY